MPRIDETGDLHKMPTTERLENKGIRYTMLKRNQEQMFYRFRRNTLPRSLAATFGTTEREAVAIINREIDARLKGIH